MSTPDHAFGRLRQTAGRAWSWLRQDIQSDIGEWQDRGIILSSLLAAADAWFWFASGIRYLVHILVTGFYLDGSLDDIKHNITIWNAHPVVIDRTPIQVESNARVLTAFVGIVFIVGLGWPLPRLSLGTFESRVWVASQFYFLLADPFIGILYRGLVGNPDSVDGDFVRLRDREPSDNSPVNQR